MPTRCPWCPGSHEDCRVKGHGHRERKTGPGFPLVVARCSVHGHAFTIYPLGHVPYGRRAVAPATTDGEVLRHGPGEREVGRPAWDGTIFAAATDAAEERLWDRGSGRSWQLRTQGRWLELGATMLGLTAAEDRVREQLAECLGLATMDLIAEARAYRAATGPHARALAIERTLERLPVRRRLCDDLLVCGAIAGLWGRPSRWDPGGPQGGVLRALF
jgi:hypothetical protein